MPSRGSRILSVGEERAKGINSSSNLHDSWRRRRSASSATSKEGDLFHNVADVIVTDGFVGNVVLKTGEGMIADLAHMMRDTLLGGSLRTKIGTAMLAPAFKRLRKRFDCETYGAAPLLGLRGNCIVTHGRASRKAIKHGIGAAVQEVNSDVVGKISEYVLHRVLPAPLRKRRRR